LADRPTLEETIALLEATLEATHDGIVVVDLDRHIILYNRQYLKMFGLTSDDLERGGADGLIETLSPQLEDLEAVLLKSHAIWSDPSSEVLDIMRFKDGRIYQRYIAPHRVNAQIVGRVASFRDIGESVRAAEAIEQHRAFLEKAQEVAHIGSFVAELDGTDMLGWSAETHRIFGVPLGQFTGTSQAFFAFVHEEDRDTVRRAAEAAQAGTAAYEIEHRITRADGSVRWVQEKADVLRDGGGKATRMVGTVQDITDRRLLEDQLRQSQKMEAIGRLAGGIAHDLNNALTAIAGYAELALGEVPAGHAARPDVEEIRKAAERAGSVTRQLLAFSRKQLLEPRLFNLNDTVVNIARLLTRLLGANVHVETKLAASLPEVLGDPGQVEQAIINLAVNARDAMPSGGRLTLTTSTDQVDEEFARRHLPMAAGRYVALRVTDTGHGMTRETQARVFEPFFTTKEVGKGTGLGLSMVYGTLKQIGGFIFVDSEVDRGTTFRLYFPPAEDNSAAMPPAQARASSQHGENKGHETLMVVEDETAVRNLVASALRHDGYHLLLATSAEEALRLDEGHPGPIDLLLTDAIMPGKSGIELAAAMAARRPGLPVIIMSGYTEETLTGMPLEKPISLLQKPFTPRELRRRIRDVLDR
jgi:two-component system, cell cycle sensor histidine kinase and response regulator CckA